MSLSRRARDCWGALTEVASPQRGRWPVCRLLEKAPLVRGFLRSASRRGMWVGRAIRSKKCHSPEAAVHECRDRVNTGNTGPIISWRPIPASPLWYTTVPQNWKFPIRSRSATDLIQGLRGRGNEGTSPSLSTNQGSNTFASSSPDVRMVMRATSHSDL